MTDFGKIAVHSDCDALDTPEIKFDAGFDFKSVFLKDMDDSTVPNVVDLSDQQQTDYLVSPSESEKNFFDNESMDKFTDLDALIAQVSAHNDKTVVTEPLVPSTIEFSDLAEPEVSTYILHLPESEPEPEVSIVKKSSRKRKISETVTQNYDHEYAYYPKEVKVEPELDASCSSVFSEGSVFRDEAERSIISHSNTKYSDRRTKNNIASRKSRQNRKNKYVLMEQEALDLEAENVRLKDKVREMEEAARIMKKALVDHLASKKN